MHHFHFHPTYGLKLRIILRSRSDFNSAATRIVEDSITKQFTTLELAAPPPYHQRGANSEFCTICDSEMNHKAIRWQTSKAEWTKIFSINQPDFVSKDHFYTGKVNLWQYLFKGQKYIPTRFRCFSPLERDCVYICVYMCSSQTEALIYV